MLNTYKVVTRKDMSTVSRSSGIPSFGRLPMKKGPLTLLASMVSTGVDSTRTSVSRVSPTTILNRRLCSGSSSLTRKSMWQSLPAPWEWTPPCYATTSMALRNLQSSVRMPFLLTSTNWARKWWQHVSDETKSWQASIVAGTGTWVWRLLWLRICPHGYFNSLKIS